MYPYIHIVIPSYQALAATGAFVIICFMFFRLEKEEIPFPVFLKLLVLCVLGGLAGSKILFAITRIPWLISNFSMRNLLMLLPESGFVFYGGLFGVIFVLLFMTRKDHEMRERVFSLCTPAMPLFHAFGRIGCFMAGCCYGVTLTNPVTIGPFYVIQIPVQLIESAAEFILFGVLMLASRKVKGTKLLWIYLISYALIRFCDEFLRGDAIQGIFFGISTAQWISLMILGAFICKKFLMRKKVDL